MTTETRETTDYDKTRIRDELDAALGWMAVSVSNLRFFDANLRMLTSHVGNIARACTYDEHSIDKLKEHLAIAAGIAVIWYSGDRSTREASFAIRLECTRAITKHGFHQTPACAAMGDREKLTILVEELGEIADAMQDQDDDMLKPELIQFATMALMWRTAL